MYGIMMTGASRGIDSGFSRESSAQALREPDRSFADYLATLTQKSSARDDDRTSSGATTHNSAGRKRTIEVADAADAAAREMRTDAKSNDERNITAHSAMESRRVEDEDTNTKKNKGVAEEDKKADAAPDRIVKLKEIVTFEEVVTRDTDVDLEGKEIHDEKAAAKAITGEKMADKITMNADVAFDTIGNDDSAGEAKREAAVAIGDRVAKNPSVKETTDETNARIKDEDKDEAKGETGDKETKKATAETDEAGIVAYRDVDGHVITDSDDWKHEESGEKRKRTDGIPRASKSDSADEQGRLAQMSSGQRKNDRVNSARGVAQDNASREGERNEGIVREIQVNLSDEAESTREESSLKEFRELMVRSESAASGLPERPSGVSIPDASQQLARRLNGSLGDNIVRQARVILKNANEGEVRLVIRPPELGRVRIQLQMDQGHIAGRILVDNQSVRQAIEQNLAALQRAFADAGLEMGELEVSTGDARQNPDAEARNNAATGERRRTEDGVEQFGRSVKTPVEFDYGNRHINLVA